MRQWKVQWRLHPRWSLWSPQMQRLQPQLQPPTQPPQPQPQPMLQPQPMQQPQSQPQQPHSRGRRER